MDVEVDRLRSHCQVLRDESGQSLLEFSLMMPVIVGLLVLLVRINTAIQVSIANQKYARSQMLYLTVNSPVYPVLRLRVEQLDGKGENRMVVGMSENTRDATGNFEPLAVVQNVNRKRAPLRCDTDEAGLEDPDKRSCVRVRTTVGMCTQQAVIGSQPLLEHARVAGSYVPNGTWQLRDDTKFAFCRGPS